MNRLASKLVDIRARVAALEPPVRAELDSSMALEHDEHFRFQECQSYAHVSGILSRDEALLIYAALGEYGSSSNGGWAASTDTATKVLVTLTVGELLGRRLAAA